MQVRIPHQAECIHFEILLRRFLSYSALFLRYHALIHSYQAVFQIHPALAGSYPALFRCYPALAENRRAKSRAKLKPQAAKAARGSYFAHFNFNRNY